MQIKKLGFVGLTAIVFGSMIGSGIFNIPQNMSSVASVGAVMIAWVITAVGILFLVSTFKILSDRRPDLNAGIYQYAQEGFGNYLGFNIAWGYWLCTAFGNVAYGVMFNDSMGVFFPELLRHGWVSFAFGSALIWTIFFIVTRGIRSASVINTAITIMKILSLILIVVLLVVLFDAGMFTRDFWGDGELGYGVTEQVKRTMLVTLWCFVGIEGAVSMSARARRPSDVGRAGVFGFILAWVLYVLVSVLAFGVMQRAQMSSLENPSVAYLLKEVCGEWAYYFVLISIICSLAGGWIAWTLICTQVPFEAAVVKIFPRQFARLNRHGMPAYGLCVSSVAMQVFFMIVLMSDSVYMAAIQVTSMMVLPAYLFSGIFLWKATYDKERYLHVKKDAGMVRYRLTGIVCTVFCLWFMYAGGQLLLLSTSLFYLPGTFFYMMARRQNAPGGDPAFTRGERWGFTFLCACCVMSVILISQGMVQ